jgi:hypothetical protein
MHWLCFPVRLFNIGIGGSRTGKAIRESELGLLPTNDSCLRRDRELLSIGACFHKPPGLPVGSLTALLTAVVALV